MNEQQAINGWLKDKSNQLRNWVREEIKDKTGLDVRTATYSPIRVAFLGLVRINALGMADFFNAPNNGKLTATQQAEAQIVVDKLFDKWRNDFGGNRTKLRDVIAKGAKEKALGINLPLLKNIKFVKKLKEMGLGGFGNVKYTYSNKQPTGIGEPLTLSAIATACSTALPIIKAFSALFVLIISIVGFVKANKQTSDQDSDFLIDPIVDDGEDGDDDGFGFNLQTAGYGLLGVGVLAMLLLGDKKKKKK
jgi:hypothetical protein